MVLIAQGYEAEGLEAGRLGWWLYLRPGLGLTHRLEHLSHTMHWSGTGSEGDFHEIAGAKLALQLEQAAGYRNGLKVCARSTAAFHEDGGWSGTIEMDTGRTPGGVGLGEVGHSQKYYDTGQRAVADYQSTWPRAYAWGENRPPEAFITAVTFVG
jgi:hypothetical protein